MNDRPTLPGLPTDTVLLARWDIPNSPNLLILLDTMNANKGAWEHSSWVYDPSTGETSERQVHSASDPMQGFWRRTDAFKGIVKPRPFISFVERL